MTIAFASSSTWTFVTSPTCSLGGIYANRNGTAFVGRRRHLRRVETGDAFNEEIQSAQMWGDRSIQGFGRFIYTSDVGTRYSVKVAWRTGEHPRLGFDPYTDEEINNRTVFGFPASGLEMRYINVVDPVTRRHHQLPVGKLPAPIFSNPPASIEYLDATTGVTSTHIVNSRVGENWRACRPYVAEEQG